MGTTNTDATSWTHVTLVVVVILAVGYFGHSLGSVHGATEPQLHDPSVTGGDDRSDQLVSDLDVDVDVEYTPRSDAAESFFVAFELVLEEDPAYAQEFVMYFVTADGISEDHRSILDNYATVAASDPAAVQPLNRDLLAETPPPVTDRQLEVLVALEADDRRDVVRSENLSDPDWANSGLANWEELRHGTDPLAADTSGDGIPDGPSVTNTEVYPNADPLQKDLYLEVDRLAGTELSPTDIDRMQRVFENAPVDNPDGSQGINLHVVVNDEIPVSWEDTSTEELRREHSEYWKHGYQYAVVVERDDLTNAHGIHSHDMMRVEDHGSPTTGATLLHELGHSLGIASNLEGVDSTDVAFADYESAMNYNSPNDFYGFSDGGESAAGTNDWTHIDCNLAGETTKNMQPEAIEFDSRIYHETKKRSNDRSDCVFGFEIVTVDPGNIYVRQSSYDGEYRHENVTEIEREFDGTTEGENFVVLEDHQTVNVSATITNTDDHATTQNVTLRTWNFSSFTYVGKQDLTLEPGETETIYFDLDTATLDKDRNAWPAIVYYVTTEEDRAGRDLGRVGDERGLIDRTRDGS